MFLKNRKKETASLLIGLICVLFIFSFGAGVWSSQRIKGLEGHIAYGLHGYSLRIRAGYIFVQFS